MERRLFRRLVVVGFIKTLTLSVAGMIDCAIVGRFYGTSGLSAMKLAMPVFFPAFPVQFNPEYGSVRLRLPGFDEGKPGTCRHHDTKCLHTCRGDCRGRHADRRRLPFHDHDAPRGQRFRSGHLFLCHRLCRADPHRRASDPYDILGTLAMLEGADRHMRCASVVLLVADILGDLVAVRLNAGMVGIALASGFSYFCACVIVASFFSACS